MGINVVNCEFRIHGQPTGNIEWYMWHHFSDHAIDTKSPLFSGSSVSAIIASAKDQGQTLAQFSAVVSAIGNGVGTWYDAQCSAESAWAATCRRVAAGFP